MARQVQLRRGTAVQHNTFTGVVGELTMNTTNNSLRLHDGATVGGYEMLKSNLSNAILQAASTFSLLDSAGNATVKITNVADPTAPQDVATKAYVDANAGGGSIDNLTDVDTSTTPPVIGQFLSWDGNNWVPADGSSVGSINDLSDVDIVGIVNGQFLRWDGAKFVEHTLSLADISDANTLATQAELDTTQASVGLNANGSRPNYVPLPHIILNTDTVIQAIGKIDTELKEQQSIDDALNISIGAVNGVKNNYTSLNYINNADDLVEAISSLDGELATKVDVNDVGTSGVDKVLRLDANGKLNSNLLDGALPAISGASLTNVSKPLSISTKALNYTSQSNTLFVHYNLEDLLVTLHDTASNGDVFYIQLEAGFTRTTLNTANASAVYKGLVYSNPNPIVLNENPSGLYELRFIDDGNNAYWYVNALSSSLHTLNNVDINAIANGQTIVWDQAQGLFIPSNIITNTTSIQQEIQEIETTLGAYIANTGEWVQPNGTTHIDTATSFSDALDKLDTAIETKLATAGFTNATIKAKIAEDITGLNADSVDGIQGGNITTLNGVQTITGNKTFTGNVDLTGSASVTVTTNPLANGNEVASATFVRALIAGAGGVSQLDDLTDVVITNPTANKQALIHDGVTFVNRQLGSADLSDSNTLATTITTTAIQNELDTTQASVGLDGNGVLPVYISTHYIADNDSHHLSLGNLDNALANTDASLAGLTVTVGTKLPSADFTATNIKNLVNADNTGLNADLLDNLNSTAFVQVTSLDTNAGNVLGAIPTLDANGHIKTTQLPDLAITHVESGLLANRPIADANNEGDIYITTDTFQTFISTGTDWSEILNPNATSIAELQTEIDDTQTSLGLNNDGSRPVYSSTNYILNADSHHVAIGKLDTQTKANTDSLDLLGTASLLDDADIFKVANAFNEIAGDNVAKANARTNLSLGTASTKDIGTANGNVVELGADGLPIVSGINLTALPSIDKLSDVITTGANAPANGQFLSWNGTNWIPANANAYTDEDARNAVGTALENGNSVGISFTNNDGNNTIEAVVTLASTDLTDTANIARLDATQTFTNPITLGATSFVTTPAGAVGNEIASATFVRGLIAGAGGVTQLHDLADVEITNPTANKQALIHNGTTFVNRVLASSDLSDIADFATTVYVDTEITNLNLGTASTYDAGTLNGQVLLLSADNTLPVLSGVNLTGVVLSTEKGANSGVATLDGSGKIPTSQLPNLAITTTTSDIFDNRPVASNDNEGDFYITTDTHQTFISGGAVAGWYEIDVPYVTADQAILNELDTTQLSVGLNPDGSRPNYSGAPHNILNTDTVIQAIDKLDVQVHNAHTELTAFDTSIGATNGVKSNFGSTNYIQNGENIVTAISTLDAQVKTNTDAIALKLDTATYTANDVLTKIKTVDGHGSGLDADTIDGIEGSNLATLNGNNTFTGINNFSGVITKISGANSSFQVESANDNLTKFSINANNGDTEIQGALTVNGTTTLAIATATSPNAGDDSTRIATTAWVQDEIAGFNPIASLDDLTDVVIGGVALSPSQTLRYNGAEFVNSQLASTDLSDTADLIRVGDNATTASQWDNSITLTLGTDLSGNVSFDGSAGVTLNATITTKTITFSESGVGADTKAISLGDTIKFAGATNETVVSLDTVNNEFLIGLSENVEIQGNLTVGGDLNVVGSVTSINTTNLEIKDSMILLSDGTVGAPVNDSGFIIERGTSANASLFWDEGNDRFEFITGTGLTSLTTDVSLTGGTLSFVNVKMGGLITDSISSISGTLTLNDVVVLTNAPALGDDSNKVATTAWVQDELVNIGAVNSLGDLSDVILGLDGGNGVALAEGQALRFDAGTNKFRNGKLSLNDLNGVSTGVLVDGHVLRSNGTTWTNSLLSASDLSDSNTLARLNNPNFTGTPTAPTAIANTNTTQLATTAFVNTAITNLGLGNMAFEDTTSFLQVANNLSDLNNTTTARTNLGLGNVATLNTGTGVNQVLKFTVADTLPAVSGANLTSLGSINTLSDVTVNLPTNVQVLKWNNTEWINTQLASTDLNDSGDLARLASPALTGNPTAPTQPANTNNTTIATTAFVQQEISNASIGDLSNVDLTNNANGKVLQYNGADFVPVSLANTDISGLGTASTKDAGTLANQVLLLSVNNTLPVLDGTNLTGLVLSTDYDDLDVLNKIKNVDGSGSGLDADLLDGLNSTAFLQVANNLSDLNNTTTARTNLGLGSSATYNAGTGANEVLLLTNANTLPALDGNNLTGVVKTTDYTANDVLSKLVTVDGTGSGLDADLLDGLNSLDFLQVGNNLFELSADPTLARTNLGLGNSSTYNAGTGANEVLLLNANSTLPALSGANLTSLPSIDTLSDVNVNTNTITEGQLLSWDDTNNEFVARSVGDLSNVVLDNRNTTFSAELRATTQANNNNSTLVATTAFVQSVLSGSGLNPNDFFQLVNLFNEIAGNAVDQAIARNNLGLGSASTYNVGLSAGDIPVLDSLGRTPDSVDYGSVADVYNANTDFTIDYQDAGVDGSTPLNAESLFQEVLVYANEDYGCLIS